jgi:hypothetical protein
MDTHYFKVSAKNYLMTENYLIDDGNFPYLGLTFGVRSILGQVSLDYGLIFPREIAMESSGYLAFPWLSKGIPILPEARNLKIDAGF